MNAARYIGSNVPLKDIFFSMTVEHQGHRVFDTVAAAIVNRFAIDVDDPDNPTYQIMDCSDPNSMWKPMPVYLHITETTFEFDLGLSEEG